MLEIFKDVPGVQVFMSEKKAGNLKLLAPNFEENRKKYFDKNNLNYEKLVSAKLEHGNNIQIIIDNQKKFVDYTDGLLTNNFEIILSVTVADCLPIFVFDPVQKVVGVLHCGWRGVAGGIIEKASQKMEKNFGSDLKNVLVGIGPGIQSCHFEVENDLLENFKGYEKFSREKNNKKYLDLKGIVRAKLISNGIEIENIEIDKRCTFCQSELWSYRRDGEDSFGVQAMMAGIKLID